MNMNKSFKQLLILIFIFLSSDLLAESESLVVLHCHNPTTSFEINQVAKQVTLTLTHHHGVEYTPIYNGAVMPYDISYLKKSSRILSKLPSILYLRWSLEDCRFSEKAIFECRGLINKNINGIEIKSASLVSKKQSQHLVMGKQTFVNIDLSINVDNSVHHFTSSYALNTCF